MRERSGAVEDAVEAGAFADLTVVAPPVALVGRQSYGAGERVVSVEAEALGDQDRELPG